jgi:hypothetical protein
VSTTPDFAAHLTQQLGFLERSAAAFDAGHAQEAIRIGTALRVIFHDTRMSTSLLRHLKAMNVLVRSEAPDRTRQYAHLAGKRILGEFSWSLAQYSLEGFCPCTNPSGPHRLIEAPVWWTETFAHMEGIDYSRKLVVLWAANKDGGAHVDDEPVPHYEQLKAAGSIGSIEAPGGQSIPIQDAHLIFLRTMAFEVLNSPDLVALAK